MLIPHPTGGENLLNNKVSAENQEVTPWWQKERQLESEEKPKGEKKPKSEKKLKGEKKPKAIKKRSMTKDEWKKRQTSITQHYLSKMTQNMKQALALEARLQASRQKALDLAIERNVDVKLLDLPVSSQQSQYQDEVDNAVVQPRSLTKKLVSRTWIQRSFIIFIYLHPQMGNKNIDYTCRLTGVKANTLLGWITKPSLIECWIKIVTSLKARDTLKSLPSDLQDCFNDIDGNSTVCLHHYNNRIKPGNQPKILFTGLDVSLFFIASISCLHYLFFTKNVFF
jgi:hypothetical protein